MQLIYGDDSVASFAGSVGLMHPVPQARLPLARGFTLPPAGAGSLRVTSTVDKLRRPPSIQPPSNLNQRGHHRHRDGARLWRRVAGDLDAVSSLSFTETFWYHDLAAGNDSASSRPPGAVNRQRGW